MRVIEVGELEMKCASCRTKFAFASSDCFVRYEVCGMIDSGTFAREPHIYVRCPICKKRVDVTGKVSIKATEGNKDPLCKCEGNYCHCDREEP